MTLRHINPDILTAINNVTKGLTSETASKVKPVKLPSTKTKPRNVTPNKVERVKTTPLTSELTNVEPNSEFSTVAEAVAKYGVKPVARAFGVCPKTIRGARDNGSLDKVGLRKGVRLTLKSMNHALSP